MAKKSQVDEQIDSFFANLNPATQGLKSRRNPKSKQDAPIREHLSAPKRPVSSGSKLFLPIGIVSVCLLTAAFVFTRFQVAFTAPRSEQSMLALPDFNPHPPNPTKVPDIQPPSVPDRLTATIADTTTVNLTWAAASDNLEVLGYTIYRNGVSVATASSSLLTFHDRNTTPGTTYSYAIEAYDQAGNHSAISAPVQVTIPGKPGNQVFFLPEEDTYVNAESPDSVYGTSKTLRIDASPNIHAYLRFVVTGLNGKTIARARLMLYTESGTARGIQVVSVLGNTWNELGTNYHNAPALGEQLAVSPPTENGTWIALDVTPYITGEGRFNFGIITDSPTAIHLASRESGPNSPKLSLDLH